MVIASRILGDQVGSIAPAFLAILAVHVIAGLTAVITGVAAALARKGSARHVRAGRWYYRAIAVVFVTATALAIMRWAQDYHLFILGAVAFTAATAGYLHQRWRRPGDAGHILRMGIAYTAMLTAFYVDNGPHLPPLGPAARPRVLAGPGGHRRAAHHARRDPRQDEQQEPALPARPGGAGTTGTAGWVNPVMTCEVWGRPRVNCGGKRRIDRSPYQLLSVTSAQPPRC